MKPISKWLIAVGVAAVLVLTFKIATRRVAAADTHKPVTITRLYTGPDGLTHSEEVEMKFATGGTTDVAKLMATAGAELHRTAPGHVNDYHTAPRRQYVITLSGRGEIELADGKKIELTPGHIELAEDVTGKGHITRVVGNEDRISIQIPLADQSGH